MIQKINTRFKCLLSSSRTNRKKEKEGHQDDKKLPLKFFTRLKKRKEKKGDHAKSGLVPIKV